MAIVSALDTATRGLIQVAVGVHDADEEALAALMSAARSAGTGAVWIEELVLMAVLFAGFPRALVLAAALRKVEPLAGDVGDAAEYDRWSEWRERGEATCRRIYGANYDALRRNVRALHPALDAWIVTDGYGRTLSRPGSTSGAANCAPSPCWCRRTFRGSCTHICAARSMPARRSRTWMKR